MCVLGRGKEKGKVTRGQRLCTHKPYSALLLPGAWGGAGGGRCEVAQGGGTRGSGVGAVSGREVSPLDPRERAS